MARKPISKTNTSRVIKEPRLYIEYWPLAKLTPYVRNPRKNDAAVDRMVASIQEYGFTIPVLARSSGEVIDGHLRLKAAVRLAIAEIPVILCDGWTEAQVKAFRLMVNRSVAWAQWDMEALAVEFNDLKALDFDLSLTGFDTGEIDRLILAPVEGEDDAPELPESPVTRAGDMWLMGKHRVLCGDATNASDVTILLAGQVQPFLMVTDPPYGVNYDPEWRDETLGRANRAVGHVDNDDRADWREAWALFPGSVAYVWHSAIHAAEVASSLESFTVRAQIIWAKSHIAIGRGAYHWQHEPCWYAVRNGHTAHWHGDRKQSTLWAIPKPQKSETGHGTQKPVELMRRPILNHTTPGEAVYDPFLGSGTTLVACELTDRICLGIDIDPKYCDVIVTRWQNLTGKEATLENGGATFAHVKQGRQLGAQDAIKEEVFA